MKCWSLAVPLLLVSVAAAAADPNDILRMLQNSSQDYPTCGDCYCIPNEGEACPDNKPETDYTDLIPILQTFTWENPFSLDCDPYVDADCKADPPLEQGGGACVVELTPSTKTCPEEWSYSTSTYNGTFEQAKAEGLLITHEGHCGTCSSLQDLSAYMEQGALMRNEAQKCGVLGLGSAEAGIQCFRDLGFTDACADIWYYNTNKTREECGAVCAQFVLSGDPANGDPPECQLAECLQCDEDESGPIFQEYAGRTRRNSGLLSGIVRPCSELVDLDQTDPCENMTASPAMTPTDAPTPSSATTVTASLVVTLLGSFLFVATVV